MKNLEQMIHTNELTELIIEYIKNKDLIIEDSDEYEEFRQELNKKCIKFDDLFKKSLQKQLSKLYNKLNQLEKKLGPHP